MTNRPAGTDRTTAVRISFSLCGLLLFVTLAALPGAWVSKERRQSEYEQQIAKQLTALGGRVRFSGPVDLPYVDVQPRWRTLLGNILGPRIRDIDLESPEIVDLTPLIGLSGLVSLSLENTNVKDLTPLVGLMDLRLLDLNGVPVSDLKPIAGLSNLSTLLLDGTQVSDLTPLAALTNLWMLDLSNTPVSDDEVTQLQRSLPNCKVHYAWGKKSR